MQKPLERVEKRPAVCKCRVSFRMDGISRCLWVLKNPLEYMGFI
jgi:hypothetical protein